MKIYTKEMSHAYNKETKELTKAGFIDKTITEIHLDFKAIDLTQAYEMDGNVFIPYHSEELRNGVQSIAYDIACQNDWCYPDTDKTETTIVFFDNEPLKPILSVDVVPRHYEPEDIDGCWVTKEIADCSNAYLNGARGLDMTETNGIAYIQFKPDEQIELLWYLLQHFSFIAGGGRYAK